MRDSLRQLWMRSPERSEAMKLARVEQGIYLCNDCNRLYSPRQVYVDHITAVTPSDWDGQSWDHVIPRLFCGVEGLQVLCKECHDKKTERERLDRAHSKLKSRERNQLRLGE